MASLSAIFDHPDTPPTPPPECLLTPCAAARIVIITNGVAAATDRISDGTSACDRVSTNRYCPHAADDRADEEF